VRLFRITRQTDRAAAFDGVSASLYPGRWNERTRRVVYVASRIPLGILEILVQSSGAPLVGYFAYPLDVPDELLETFNRSALSATWRTADRGRFECRGYGEGWRARGTSAGLIVPSAVLPEAYDFGDVNVVLNPLHPDFARVRIAEPVPLDVDSRLQVLVSALPSTTVQRRSRRKAAGSRRPVR
jgi:RES domain-containing protein